jgi:hypothetical protein
MLRWHTHCLAMRQPLMNKNLIFLGLMLLVLFGLPKRAGASDQYRPDVLACEEAVSYLDTACPDFDPSKLRCVYEYNEGCGNYSYIKPALSEAEVQCILGKQADSLAREGICARAQAATSPTGSGGSGTTTGTSHPPVCQ